jgi:Ca2+-binding EF-hand superfamily protein
MVKLLIFAAGLLTGTAAAAQTAPAAPVPDQTVRADVVKSLSDNFGKADVNNDGFLNEAEVQTLTNRVNQQIATRLDQEFKNLDKDSNGQLSPAEFKAGAGARMMQVPAVALQRLDANKDGKVNPAEFSAVALAAFDRIDANKDGTISAEEKQAASTRR